jgi:hypothetical protein
MTELDQITHAQMKEAIQRSGYMMEQRIFPVIEDNGYYVEQNRVYPDPTTGKPREYDFFAMTSRRLFREAHDLLVTHIIGECINNNQPVVFFKAQSPMQSLFHQELASAGIPLYFPDEHKEDGKIPMNDYFNIERFHHYCEGSFSTQYCSFHKKGGKDAQWMAWHEDEHHGVFNSLVEATKFAVNEWYSYWEPPADGKEQPVDVNLFYPLLVLRGDLYEFSQKGRSVSLRSKEHIQFRKSVITDGEPDTCQVDVIIESFLPRYLDILWREQDVLQQKFRKRKQQMRKAIENIVTKARAMTDETTEGEKSFRDVLDI